jgi:hypothetical protein
VHLSRLSQGSLSSGVAPVTNRLTALVTLAGFVRFALLIWSQGPQVSVAGTVGTSAAATIANAR